MTVIYLDNNATTRVDDAVMAEIMPYFQEQYGNASSMHTFGGQVGKKIEEARGRIATLLHCLPNEIIFTSGGTESDNTAIHGTLSCYPEKKHVITSRVEHPAVRTTCRLLQRQGYRVTELPVDEKGRLNLDELSRTIGPDTAMVSIMAANNETGTLFPIKEIAEICQQRGCVFHTDAVQAVGKVPLDMETMPIDLLSLSGHKLHAPKGVGVLYVRRGTRVSPFMVGGHQEFNRRAGTENIPGIVGLGKACEIAHLEMDREKKYVSDLRDRLERGLCGACPYTRVNGDQENRLPNTTNISFEYIEGEAILLRLDVLGIAASSGSACTSGSLEPSHVLRAMGVPFTAVHGSIRFSLSKYNTTDDIDYVIKELPPVIETLRDLSPFSPEHAPEDPEAVMRS